jgi:hypothetical protein
MSLNWPVLRFLLIPSPSVALSFTGRFRLSGLSLLLLTFCLPSGVSRAAEQRGRLHYPPEFPRLVVGDLPGFGKKFSGSHGNA